MLYLLNNCLKNKIIFIVILFFAFSILAFAEHKNILILHSYHPEYTWTSTIDSKIKEVLSKYNDIEYFTEYLDTKRFNSPQYLKLIKNNLIFKYQNKKIDLIIVADNTALNIIVDLKDKIFKNIPVIFCGINHFKKSLLRNYRDITGVREDLSVDETINIINKLHPEIKKILFLGDTHFLVYKYYNKGVVQDYIKNSTQKELKLEIVENKFLDDLVKEYKNVKNVAFIVISGLRLKNGEFLLINKASKYLADKIPAPFYTLWDIVVYSDGAVGGKVVNASEQGRLAAQYAIKILKDNISPENLDIITSTKANRWLFNYKYLEKFGIKLTSLPENSIIINKPNNFIKIPKKNIYIIISLLLTITAVLTTITLYKIRTETILQRYKIITDNTFDIIIETDEKGNIHNINGKFKEILGFDKDELLQLNIKFFYDDEKERDKFINDILLNRQINNYLRVLKNRNNEKRYFLLSATLFKKGRNFRILSVLKDITNEFIHKEELSFFEYIIENSPLIIVITDMQGKILKVNKFAADKMGFKKDELIGKDIREFRSKEHNEEFYNDLWNSLKEKGFWQGEFINKRKDGTIFYENAVITKMKYKNQDIVIKFGTDITELKKYEKQMMANQKFELLGKFSSSIAHDFNNILAVNSNYTQYLKMKLTDEKDQIILKKILDSINRGSQFISQLLAFSRQSESKTIQLNISRYVEDEKDTFRRIINDSIDLSVEVKQKKLFINTDLILLEQMFLNLLKNAEYALLNDNKKEKKLKLTLDKKCFSENVKIEDFTIKKGCYVEITIEDNGIGIKEKDKSKIFEPFFTTKPSGEGTGLGLSSVYGFIKRFNGYIIVKSEYKKYTKFIIYLPLLNDASEDNYEQSKENNKISGNNIKKIVFIDDNIDILEGVKISCEALNIDVVPFSDGNEAVKYIVNHKDKIDLVATDISMPGFSGNDVVRILLSKGFNKPIIMISGYGINAADSDLLNYDNVKFYRKPFKLIDILETLNN
ncbi:PAS domain S-box protein [Deferribacter autotrophicus]|uniref:histidine kinase n=1 Tax=Deferribacter autotrophicus TaxID=500465 RepID=A0A5A8EZH6_9BACT|nr:ABC transporter substrate binding protein [Deferribacter autotrophicus]KAA0256893.1 PAS domain S-box protein [Deferribacter autotrophicus]